MLKTNLISVGEKIQILFFCLIKDGMRNFLAAI
jgi:hypothetical protein